MKFLSHTEFRWSVDTHNHGPICVLFEQAVSFNILTLLSFAQLSLMLMD